MTTRKVADATTPYAATWDLSEDTLSVVFISTGARSVTFGGPLQGMTEIGGEETRIAVDVPIAGPARGPRGSDAFEWAAEQVNAAFVARGWDARCVACRVGDVDMLTLEVP